MSKRDTSMDAIYIATASTFVLCLWFFVPHARDPWYGYEFWPVFWAVFKSAAAAFAVFMHVLIWQGS